MQNIMVVRLCDRGYSPYGREEADSGKATHTGYNFQKHIPGNLLLPARPHLLNFLPPSKTPPPAEDKVLTSKSCGDHFLFKSQ
jgi:hypothetical protein